MDFGASFGDDAVYLRAFAPFVPHDYDISGLPAALFRFVVMNRSPNAKAVEIALQWQSTGAAPTKSRGNVETVLGWRRDQLAPGKSWKPAPTLVFARNRSEMAEQLKKVSVSLESLAGAAAPEGKSYAFGDVKDFLVDDLGGFDWETHRRESGVFGGAPNIGQLFWNLSYGDKHAGRGREGGYGLKGVALPTRTKDGKLEVRLRVANAGPNCLALVFTVLNVSNETLRDLRFGLAVNADVGGAGQAEDQRGEFDPELKAAVVENTRTGQVLALAGHPDDCIVGTWPNAHAAILNNEWVPLDAQPAASIIQTSANGSQVKLPNGSYAVGAMGDPKWSIKNDPTVCQTATNCEEDGVIRTRAVRTLGPNETVEVTL